MGAMSEEEARIEVHLYGALRGHAAQREVSRESVVSQDFVPGGSIGDVLRRLGITESDVSNIFHNGRLAAREDVLQPGDRLGVFPPDISLLYC